MREILLVSLWKLNGTGFNRRSTKSWTRLCLTKLHPPVTVYPGSLGLFDVRFVRNNACIILLLRRLTDEVTGTSTTISEDRSRRVYVLLNLATLHLLLKLHFLTSQKCFETTLKISARMTTVWQI